MITRISDIIHDWTGWCPDAQSHVRKRPVLNAVIVNAPPPGESFRAGAMNWFARYRNQVLLSTIAITCTGFWLFLSFGGWPAMYLFVIGMGAGLLNSAIVGTWYWRLFERVLRYGPVEPWNYQYSDKIMSAFTIVISALLIVIPVLGLFGLLPDIGLRGAIAFGGGFVAVLTWGTLASIWLWEFRTRRTLQYNFELLNLAEGGTHADS
jgi:hypothetical protein